MQLPNVKCGEGKALEVSGDGDDDGFVSITSQSRVVLIIISSFASRGRGEETETEKKARISRRHRQPYLRFIMLSISIVMLSTWGRHGKGPVRSDVFEIVWAIASRSPKALRIHSLRPSLVRCLPTTTMVTEDRPRPARSCNPSIPVFPGTAREDRRWSLRNRPRDRCEQGDPGTRRSRAPCACADPIPIRSRVSWVASPPCAVGGT